MKNSRLIPILVLSVAAWLPGSVQAIDTATELRLRSIEARLPDADELAALERKVNKLSSGEPVAQGSSSGASGGSFSMLQDIQSLQDEVRSLRGEVEELKFDIKKAKQSQSQLYEDLDGRLQALEGGGTTSNSAGPSSEPKQASAQGQGKTGGTQSPANEGDAETAYLAAFGLLKEGKYAESRSALNRFVNDYPNSSYTDNAWYWLGEANYVDREYAKALTAFRKVLSDFPDSSKAGGALYKTGVIQDEQGDSAGARVTFTKVVEQYPKDNAAELARKRLDAIGG